ncbi:MAG TPA: antibiotic biosynthesis monooxygenase [Beijerinckiaceae bacterium]
MFIRITWGKLKPGAWDDYEAAFRKVMPQTMGAAGMRGRWLIRDLDEKDAGYSIAMFESERDMRGYTENAEVRAAIREALDPFHTGEYTTKHCEVKVELPPKT